MRAAIPVLLLLAVSASAQTPDQQFDFPGGVVLKVGVDSMTDAQRCVVITSQYGRALILVNSNATAMISAFDSVDYSQPAFLRIGDAPAFRLRVPGRPGQILIPLSRSAEVVRAL